MSDPKVPSLEREFALLCDLCKAKDELIQFLKANMRLQEEVIKQYEGVCTQLETENIQLRKDLEESKF
jgi:hypothetical protein